MYSFAFLVFFSFLSILVVLGKGKDIYHNYHSQREDLYYFSPLSAFTLFF